MQTHKLYSTVRHTMNGGFFFFFLAQWESNYSKGITIPHETIKIYKGRIMKWIGISRITC